MVTATSDTGAAVAGARAHLAIAKGEGGAGETSMY